MRVTFSKPEGLSLQTQVISRSVTTILFDVKKWTYSVVSMCIFDGFCVGSDVLILVSPHGDDNNDLSPLWGDTKNGGIFMTGNLVG